jgi:hypothetical protein
MPHAYSHPTATLDPLRSLWNRIRRADHQNQSSARWAIGNFLSRSGMTPEPDIWYSMLAQLEVVCGPAWCIRNVKFTD